jgi:hypothetical protein
MVGKRVGGTITFGGGLVLSGGTACADHCSAFIPWRLLTMAPKATFFGKITLGSTNHPRRLDDGATQGTN